MFLSGGTKPERVALPGLCTTIQDYACVRTRLQYSICLRRRTFSGISHLFTSAPVMSHSRILSVFIFSQPSLSPSISLALDLSRAHQRLWSFNASDTGVNSFLHPCHVAFLLLHLSVCRTLHTLSPTPY
jgi:hypothetical protein